tara:strand:+ start:55 stop:570 length:516 start_codon:yes stop_codon:yes gene_type:complete
MKVIDNFLPSYQFKQIYSIMMGSDFPWYYNPTILDEDSDDYIQDRWQLSHTFHHHDKGAQSSFNTLMEPIISRLEIKPDNLLRIKANLNPKTIFHRRGGYHTDIIRSSTRSNVKIALLYVNSNNGWTHIKGYGKVKSVANRMVIFDCNLFHSGYTCTDEKTRVVINFNWKK